jgi:glycerophosphoryl diester phosphodiesterase
MASLDWLIARPIAHRGLHDAAQGVIENTPSAFAAAIAGNYAIECDLQITSDGEAMVYHDDALDRLTEGDARLDAMTTADLKQVAFRATRDRMITLGELCDLVAGRVTLVIELKSHDDGDLRLVARAAVVLSGYTGRAAVMSFDPAQIAALRAIAPALVRGLVAESHPKIQRGNGERPRLSGKARQALAYIRDASHARPQFIAYSVKDLPAAVTLAAGRLLRRPILTWTVRTEEDQRRAARWADQMIFEGFRP